MTGFYLKCNIGLKLIKYSGNIYLSCIERIDPIHNTRPNHS